jgi:hypothetical protein
MKAIALPGALVPYSHIKVPSLTSRFSKEVSSLKIKVALLPNLFLPLNLLTMS